MSFRENLPESPLLHRTGRNSVVECINVEEKYPLRENPEGEEKKATSGENFSEVSKNNNTEANSKEDFANVDLGCYKARQ